jgi:large subunit ribosomal protein L28
MSRKCQLTGRGPTVGHKVSHSHKLSKKVWNVNLQKVRVLIDGKVVRMRVSTKAIKSGMIVKPPIKLRERRAKAIRPVAVAVMEEESFDPESPPDYFSPGSVVSTMFKNKRKKDTDGEDLTNEDAFINEGFRGSERDAVEQVVEEVVEKTSDDTVPLEAYAETIPADPSNSSESAGESESDDSTKAPVSE